MSKTSTSGDKNVALHEAILEILHKRLEGKTCCPSEAARKVDPQNWRSLMKETREVAKVMREKGIIEICQKGMPVSGDSWTGPIRLRLTKAQFNGEEKDS